MSAQSTLGRTPNLRGAEVLDGGVAQFNVLHRFWATDPPVRKVVNTPTLVAAAGLGNGLMVGFRYASNSLLVSTPNEWEAYGRWRALTQAASGLFDVTITAGWNDAAGSADGELAVARSLGPLRLHVAGRGFSAFAGGGSELAYAAGASWRIHRNVALAADVETLASDTTVGWGVGLQLRVPTTPHTLSLQATTVNTTTLQGSSFGSGFIDGDTGKPRVLYGFEFTVPITLSRYFGGAAPAPAAQAPGGAAADRRDGANPPPPADTAVVRMTNRLQFLPDTVRIRVGQAVRWENTSALIHTVTADPSRAVRAASVVLPDGAAPFNSGDIRPEEAWTRVFTVPGTYKYFCIPHELAGMVGWVIVEPAPR